MNTATALKLYDTLILSHISYCAIYRAAGSNQNKLRKFHLIQKRTLRTMVQAHHRASSKPIFLTLKRLTIFDIYKTQVGSFMYANLHGFTPNLLPDYFHFNFDYHLRKTRSSFDSHLFLYMLQLFGTLDLITSRIRIHQMHLSTILNIGCSNPIPNHMYIVHSHQQFVSKVPVV